MAPFGTLERTRTSGLPLRRRSRYPLRYQGLCTMFNFFAIFGGCSYFRLGGDRSIQLSYGGLYRKYSILQGSRIRTIRFLGGGPSILVRYGGIYRNYSVIQGSGVRTVRLLGGGPSIPVRYGGISSSGPLIRRIGTVLFYPLLLRLSTAEDKFRPGDAFSPGRMAR